MSAFADWLPRGESLLYLAGAILLAIFLILRPATDLTPDNAVPSGLLQLPSSKYGLPGIDVSHHQGRIDWERVVASDISFVYLKATEGETYVDPLLERNGQHLRDLKVPFGLYHFYIPHKSPLEQAKHFVRQAKLANSVMPPVLDVEITDNESASSIRKGAHLWLQHVSQELNCKPMVYSSASFYRDQLGPKFHNATEKGYHLWLAEYADEPRLLDELGDWTMWQYSQSGYVEGIDISVDLSWFNGSQHTLDRFRCSP